MSRLTNLLSSACLVAFCTSCSHPPSEPKEQAAAPEALSAVRIYVTNEASGDMTIIDSVSYRVIATVPLGKRPRGIHASPDRKTIYVALSGSPIAGPGVDESTLPPPDRSADGIGVFDVAQNKVVRVIKGRLRSGKFRYQPGWQSDLYLERRRRSRQCRGRRVGNGCQISQGRRAA